MHTAALPQTYFAPIEAAEYLGVTTRTMAQWRRTGRGPTYVRLGGLTSRVRYERARLDEWMRARQHLHTVDERSSTADVGWVRGEQQEGTRHLKPDPESVPRRSDT